MIITSDKYNNFKVTLDTSNFSHKDHNKLYEAANIMASKIGSEEFKEFVLNYRYSHSVCYGRLWWRKCVPVIIGGMRWTNDKSQKEIYETIIGGAEVLSSEIDREADISLILDKRSKRNVLGYTYANTNKQWIYNNFFKYGTPKTIAGNLCHEWCHKLGFDHEYKYSHLRQFTVPYAVGYFVSGEI